MVEPLSKRAQLSSPSIQIQAMLSSLLHQLSGPGFKKGTSSDVFKHKESYPGMRFVQLMLSGGPSLPFSLSPLSHLNLFFGDLAKIIWRILHKMVRTTTTETILVLLLVQLNCIGKMHNIADELICSTNSIWDFLIFTF